MLYVLYCKFCNCNIEEVLAQGNYGHRSEDEEMITQNMERKMSLNMHREIDILRGKGETTPSHSTIPASVCNP